MSKLTTDEFFGFFVKLLNLRLLLIAMKLYCI